MSADQPQPTRVVVLGGGTAGWMSAAALQKLLRGFVERLGIDEAAFIKARHATYKLGIDSRDFGRIGERYVHPFGSFGEEVAGVGFHHYWLEMQRQGRADPIGTYSLACEAALANKFKPPAEDQSLASTYGYAYQFDATLFGPFMREFGLGIGVERVEGKVVEVRQDAASGDVTTLVLEDGRTI